MFKKTVLILYATFISYTIYAQGFEGYYRFPAIHGETIVFTAEGDLWKVPITGGLAQRLTTHAEEEIHPTISPDGQTIAFSASYEGPTEVYTMPIDGGLPTRWTYEQDPSYVNSWTPTGEIVYATRKFATLPDWQAIKINVDTKEKTRIPLSQATTCAFDQEGNTIYFVRPAYHNNVTKRYKGGTARDIWKFSEGDAEATEMTGQYDGESHTPMWWNNRIYFISDRDGIMNIWSMNDAGEDLKQHTQQPIFDIRDADLHNGKIVYHVGADLWLLDLKTGTDQRIPITLASDLDQLREYWVKKPQDYITAVNIDPEGKKVVVTARGRSFVMPVGSGRTVELSRKDGVRYRSAVFSSDGDQVYTLSDESGEFELAELPASGIGASNLLTNDGQVLRYSPWPSPDGKYIAYADHHQNMWIFELATKKQTKVSTNQEGIWSYSWSPDGKWLAFNQAATNSFVQIMLHHVETGKTIPLTTNRYNSVSPAWSPDGQWIYFLSDRNLQTLVGSPWGPRQPEPYFDRTMKVYQVALKKGLRSPFQEMDELKETEEEESEEDVIVDIEEDGLQHRIVEVPVKPGNYRGLAVNDQALYFMSRSSGPNANSELMALKITHQDPEAKSIAQKINRFQLSQNGKKLLLGSGQNLYVVDAGTNAISKLNDHQIDFSGWSFSLNPKEDWKQMFTDAWRMERDYFYDPNMHGVDWQAMHDQYLPLVERVTTRDELSDLIGRYVGELSALHTSVRGGDTREDEGDVRIASLGARLSRSNAKGGYVIEYIYQTDPDLPDQKGPLAKMGLDINHGDLITHVDGYPALSALDIGAFLRNKGGKQVRLGIKSGPNGMPRDVIVKPINNAAGLRYSDWEYTRRKEVEMLGNGQVGYVHLRAMGSRDINQWYREFYPVYNLPGLIIDVRHNRGGNIESLILEKLLRKDWFYWKGNVGEPSPNMQYAFRGHVVVLMDQQTASDGEAFAEGFRRLGLGKLIGMRTWGGEIWLGSSNRLSDKGLARAPSSGVYSPEGEWLIEGVGVIPDIEVDNFPHATFEGQDTQLETAVQYLLGLIQDDPRDLPKPPAYPNKARRR